MQKIDIQNIFNELACTKDVVYMSNYHSKYIWDKILNYNAKIYALIDDFAIYNKLKIEYDNENINLSYQTLCLKPELKLGNIDGLGISPGFYNRFKEAKLPEILSLVSYFNEVESKEKDIFWLDLWIDFDNYHILTELMDNKELFEQLPYVTLCIDQLLLETKEWKKISSMLKKNIYMGSIKEL